MPAARDAVEGRWHLRRDNNNVYLIPRVVLQRIQAFFTRLIQLWRFRGTTLCALCKGGYTLVIPRGDGWTLHVIYRRRQIRVWLVQSHPTTWKCTPAHSLMPLPKIGSLLGQRLGRRPNSTAALGQCLVHARITWRNCYRHASFIGQTPIPSPPLSLPSSATARPTGGVSTETCDKTVNNP